jgi:hypothetical protein
MKHVAAILLALIPTVASALQSDEFMLFGVNATGRIMDIRPYGGEGNADEATGDMDEPGGIHGNFYQLVGTETKGSLKLVGICRLLGKSSWTLACENGSLLLSGVSYKGEAITDVKAAPPAVKALYRAFIKHYQYGAPAAIFHCAAKCSSELPQELILVWRGD